MKKIYSLLLIILIINIFSQNSFSQYSPIVPSGHLIIPPNLNYKCSDSLTLAGVLFNPCQIEQTGVGRNVSDIAAWVPLKFEWGIGSHMHWEIPGNPDISNTHPKYPLKLLFKLKLTFSVQGIDVVEIIEEFLADNGTVTVVNAQLKASDFNPQFLKSVSQKKFMHLLKLSGAEINSVKIYEGSYKYCCYYWEQIDKINSKIFIENLIAQAELLFAHEDYREAKEIYDRLHKMRPDNGFVEMRLELVDKMLAKEEKEKEYKKYFNYGKELTEAGKFEDAIDEFEKALENKPGDPAARSAITQVEKKIEKREEEKLAKEEIEQNETLANKEDSSEEVVEITKLVENESENTITYTYKQSAESVKREREIQHLQNLDRVNREYEQKRQRDAEAIYNLGQNLSTSFGMIADKNRKAQQFNKVVDEQISFSSGISDPSALMTEYKNKIQNINQAFEEREVQVMNDIQRGVNNAVNINNQGATAQEQNFNRASGELAGMISSMSAQNRIAKEKKEAEAALEAELKKEMTVLKDKLVDRNRTAAERYLNSAIKSVHKNDKDYYLSMYKYHNCCVKSIEDRFYYKNNNWVKPNCSKPYKSTKTAYTSIDKDILYLNAAKRKIGHYQTIRNDGFLKSGKEILNTALYYNNRNAEAYYFRSTLSDDIIEKFTDIITAVEIEPSNTIYTDEFNKVKKEFVKDFYFAISTNKLDFIKKTIKESLYIDKLDKNSLNPLEASIKNDKGDIFKTLYNNDYYHSKYIINQEDHIMDCIIKQNANNCMQKLFSMNKELIYNYSDYPVLYIAAKEKSNAIVYFLINNNININETMLLAEVRNDKELNNYLSKEIFHWAVQEDNIEKGSMALSYYPTVFLEGDDPNCYFLCSIASENKINLFNLLIEQKKLENIDTKILTDFLLTAVKTKSNDVLKKYIEQGFPLPDQNEAGNLLHYAVENDNTDILKLFIEMGVDLNYAEKKYGNTPLHLAIINQKDLCAYIILASNPELNKLNVDGWTVLHLSVWKKNYDMTKIIIKNGANLNIKGPYGWTPLHFAVRENNKEIVQLLIDNNAKTDIKNNKGITPYKLAKRSGYKDIQNMLPKEKFKWY